MVLPKHSSLPLVILRVVSIRGVDIGSGGGLLAGKGMYRKKVRSSTLVLPPPSLFACKAAVLGPFASPADDVKHGETNPAPVCEQQLTGTPSVTLYGPTAHRHRPGRWTLDANTARHSGAGGGQLS